MLTGKQVICGSCGAGAYVELLWEIILQNEAGSTPGKTLNTKTSSLAYVTWFENMTFSSESVKIEQGGQEKRLGK